MPAHAQLVKRRLVPTAADVRALLESVSEVERVNEDALPPAGLVAHAVAAIRATAPGVQLERVAVSAQGLALADHRTRVGGVVHVAEGRAGARVRVSQDVGPVLVLDAHGSPCWTSAVETSNSVV